MKMQLVRFGVTNKDNFETYTYIFEIVWLYLSYFENKIKYIEYINYKNSPNSLFRGLT